MALKLEIIARETIKPSSPTPTNLSTYKLSLLDQLASNSYIPFVLFYSTTTNNNLDDKSSTSSNDHLKQSLSKTLTHMYPLAGRIKDLFSIECKDQGVEYVQVRVGGNMSAVLEHPKMDQLQQLLPCDPRGGGSPGSGSIGDQLLLLVQINHFGCGGTAIGMCIHHTIADFSTAGTFLTTWAEVARGQKNIADNFVVDCTPIFPPQDVSSLNKYLSKMREETDRPGTKVNRFILSGSNISALKEKATKSGWSCSDPPSRVVAVSTFIWASIIEANREGSRKNWNMSTLVNLRPKMDAPIRPHCLGNIVQGTVANCETSEEGQSINYGALAKIVTDSIRVVNDEYMKNMYADEEYFENYKRGVLEFAKYYDSMRWLNTSSWCRYPVYEADFGWGKPIWAGTATIPPNDFAIFMDTSDGEGIEAWVNLKEEDMNKLEQNPEFLAYVSVTQSLR